MGTCCTMLMSEYQLTEKAAAMAGASYLTPSSTSTSTTSEGASYLTPTSNAEFKLTSTFTPTSTTDKGTPSKSGKHRRNHKRKKDDAYWAFRPGESQFGLPPAIVPERPNRRDRRVIAAAKAIQRTKTGADE
jgi:hypothetical protein